MLADLGMVALYLAFFVAVYAAVVSLLGALQEKTAFVASGRNAIIVILPLVGLAAGIIVYSLLIGDYSLEYVASVSSRGTPTALKVTALWGGQAGSILFWNLVLAVFTAVAMLRKWDGETKRIPYVIFVLAVTQAFFLLVTNFLENPFTRLATVPADGNGLNPLLRHPGMIIHPPMLYLGFTGFTIPYAFAMAALISGQLDDGWFRVTRRWALAGWLFLSLGLVLGGRWAYDVLGWGGYWAWDPVENASFIPWLAGTAFLHSVMIQEKQRMFKAWNMFLILLTFATVMYGTFIVRSGVISSVHAFAQSAIGPFFLGFLALVLISSFVFMVIRSDKLRSENQLRSFLSREAVFLFNNFLFLGIMVIVLWGTTYPIISELVTGEEAVVGEPFYEQATAVPFLLLIVLMGVAPLTMWHHTSLKRLEMGVRWPAAAATIFVIILFAAGIHSWGALIGFWAVAFSLVITLVEFGKGVRARMRRHAETIWVAFNSLLARDRRRYGGYAIHLGVLIMGFGIIGTQFFQQQTQILLQSGESVTLGGYTAVFNGMTAYQGADDLRITEASLDLYRNGRFIKELNPRHELYTRTNQPMTIPDSRATISEDFYVLIVNWEGFSADAATFRIYLNPLINWVWAGGLIFVIGTLIAAWPDPADEKIAAAAANRHLVPAAGD